MITGCRRNEILTLRWTDVDLDAGELRLADAKTGARNVTLSPPAVKVLTELRPISDNPWVIAGHAPGKRLSNINEHWHRIRTRAGLKDVRLHDLRHSWASRALALGESLPMIGRLLGHSQVETTARYAQLGSRFCSRGYHPNCRQHRIRSPKLRSRERRRLTQAAKTSEVFRLSQRVDYTLTRRELL